MHAGPPPAPGSPVTGGFGRQNAAFTGRISWDGSSGFMAESGRYQLYASLADPWSHRALIVRRLLGVYVAKPADTDRNENREECLTGNSIDWWNKGGWDR